MLRSPGDPTSGFGRQGIEYYLRMNYLPADRVDQSVAETADAAYGDFCIGELRSQAGQDRRHDDVSGSVRITGGISSIKDAIFRGKNEDGTWLEPFDAFTWGSPYEEGAAWQHRWDVPHDIAGSDAVAWWKRGDVSAFSTEMLSLPPKFDVGVYGQEIHEMSEMAALPFRTVFA